MLNLLGLFQSKQYLSVDFSTSGVKVARANIQDNALSMTLTDKASVNNLTEDNKVEKYTEALQALKTSNSISNRENVIFSLPTNSVIVRHVELPSMPNQRLSEVIKYEAESHIPFPIDDVILDYHVLEQTDEGTRVLLVVVKNEKLEKYLEVLRNVELRPEMVDISAFSLFNLYQKVRPDDSGDEEDSEPKVLVDIGHTNTDIIIFEDETLYYARSASVAGESMSAEISEKLDVDIDRAEELKIEYGNLPLVDSDLEDHSDQGGSKTASAPAPPDTSPDEETSSQAEVEGSPSPPETEASDDTSVGELSMGGADTATESDTESGDTAPPPPPGASEAEEESSGDDEPPEPPSAPSTSEAEDQPPPESPGGEVAPEGDESETEEEPAPPPPPGGADSPDTEGLNEELEGPSPPSSDTEESVDELTMGPAEKEAETETETEESSAPSPPEPSDEADEDSQDDATKPESPEETPPEPPEESENDVDLEPSGLDSPDEDTALSASDDDLEGESDSSAAPDSPPDELDLTTGPAEEETTDQPDLSTGDEAEESGISAPSDLSLDTGSDEETEATTEDEPEQDTLSDPSTEETEETDSVSSDQPRESDEEDAADVELESPPDVEKESPEVDDVEGSSNLGEAPPGEPELGEPPAESREDVNAGEGEEPDQPELDSPDPDSSADVEVPMEEDEETSDAAEEPLGQDQSGSPTDQETRESIETTPDPSVEKPEAPGEHEPEPDEDEDEEDDEPEAVEDEDEVTEKQEQEEDEHEDLPLGQLRTPDEDDENSGDEDLPGMGAAANDEGGDPPASDFDEEGLQSAIQSQVDRLINELQQTFDYFQNEMDGDDVDEIILCGSGCKVNNLPEYVEGELGRETRRFDPLAKLKGLGVENLQSMLVVAGLQLRSVPSEATLGINLLPQDIVRRREAKRRKQKLIANGALAGILVIQMLVWLFYSYRVRKNHYVMSENQLDKVQPIVKRVEKLNTTQEALQRRIAIIEELENQQARMLPILHGLTQFPEGLEENTWYENFSVSQGDPYHTLNISGVTGDFQDTSKLYGWLEDLDFVVELQNQSQGRTTYTINGQERSMVRFSVQLSVTYTDQGSQKENSETS